MNDINHKAINRGDYCHRFHICTAKKAVDPDQAVCLICNNFLPIFPEADPLAQAKMQGLTLGQETIKKALAWEEKQIYNQVLIVDQKPKKKNKEMVFTDTGPVPDEDPEKITMRDLYQHVNKQKKKTGNRLGRPPATPPAFGMKRCSNQNCEDPILPADADHFYRSKHCPDGLMYYCKKCHNKAAMKWQRKNRASEKKAREIEK